MRGQHRARGGPCVLLCPTFHDQALSAKIVQVQKPKVKARRRPFNPETCRPPNEGMKAGSALALVGSVIHSFWKQICSELEFFVPSIPCATTPGWPFHLKPMLCAKCSHGLRHQGVHVQCSEDRSFPCSFSKEHGAARKMCKVQVSSLTSGPCPPITTYTAFQPSMNRANQSS